MFFLFVCFFWPSRHLDIFSPLCRWSRWGSSHNHWYMPGARCSLCLCLVKKVFGSLCEQSCSHQFGWHLQLWWSTGTGVYVLSPFQYCSTNRSHGRLFPLYCIIKYMNISVLHFPATKWNLSVVERHFILCPYKVYIVEKFALAV